MATDRELPGILGTAASRVDAVGRQIMTLQSQLLILSSPGLIGWSGLAALTHASEFAKVQRELRTQATKCHSLADTLRSAAKSASLRVYYEDQARERARAAAEAAAKAKKTP
jgi:hypothetical protein